MYQPDTYFINAAEQRGIKYVMGYCFDQYQVDYMTMRGGWQLPYYASSINALMPENSTSGGVVVLPWLTWDWIDSFTVSHLYETEPAYFGGVTNTSGANNVIALMDKTLDSSLPFGYVTNGFDFGWYYSLDQSYNFGLLNMESTIINHFGSNSSYQILSGGNFTNWFKNTYSSTPTYHVNYTSPFSGETIEWYYDNESRIARYNGAVVSYVDYTQQMNDPYLTDVATVNSSLPSNTSQIDNSLRFTIDALGGGQYRAPVVSTGITYAGPLSGFPVYFHPLLYYNFDEDNGTVLHDQSGNGFTGSITNASWDTGKYGSALQFNGSPNSYVTIPYNLGFASGSTLTISAWVLPNSTTGYPKGVLAGAQCILGQAIPNSGGILFLTVNDQLRFYANSNSSSFAWTQFTTGHKLVADQWNFVEVSYNDFSGVVNFGINGYTGGPMLIYLNGTVQSTQTLVQNQMTTATETRIGAYYYNLYGLNGSIDDLNIYSTAFSFSSPPSSSTITVTSAYGNPTSSGTVALGGSYATSVTSPWSGGTGIQYVCTGYTIDGGSQQVGTSYTFTNILANHTITYTWQTQYYLTVSSSYGSPTGQEWYDSGSQATFSISSVVSGGSGIQYINPYWTGQGTGSYSGYSTSNTVTMNNPINETATWTTQYYLTASSTLSQPYLPQANG